MNVPYRDLIVCVKVPAKKEHLSRCSIFSRCHHGNQHRHDMKRHDMTWLQETNKLLKNRKRQYHHHEFHTYLTIHITSYSITEPNMNRKGRKCMPSDATYCLSIGTGTTLLVPYLYVKSLQLVWRSGSHRFHLRVPYLQVSCKDLIICQGTRIAPPAMAAGWHALLHWKEQPPVVSFSNMV